MENKSRQWAEREFDILEKTGEIGILTEFKDEMLALFNKFMNSGQSGGSAPMVAGIICDRLKKLMMWQPIAPVTGEDWEWNDTRDWGNTDTDTFYQNNRQSAIFKGSKNGQAYYLDAIVWKNVDNPNDTFTGIVEGVWSRQYIKQFPFVPKTFYIDVYRELYNQEKHGENDMVVVSCGDGDYVYFIKDKAQLGEVFAYYDEYKDNIKQ